MADEADDQDKKEAATGAAVGMASRRGIFGGVRRAAQRESEGSPTLTVLVVVGLLVGTLAIMFAFGG